MLVRVLALAAAALLAGLVAVAVVEYRDSDVVPVSPQGAVAAGGGWYDALAAPRPPAGDAERTSCGLTPARVPSRREVTDAKPSSSNISSATSSRCERDFESVPPSRRVEDMPDTLPLAIPDC